MNSKLWEIPNRGGDVVPLGSSPQAEEGRGEEGGARPLESNLFRFRPFFLACG